MGGRGMFAGVGDVSRQSCIQYIQSRDLEREFEGVRGMGFIRPSSGSEVNAFIRHQRTDKDAHFSCSVSYDPIIRILSPLLNHRRAINGYGGVI